MESSTSRRRASGRQAAIDSGYSSQSQSSMTNNSANSSSYRDSIAKLTPRPPRHSYSSLEDGLNKEECGGSSGKEGLDREEEGRFNGRRRRVGDSLLSLPEALLHQVFEYFISRNGTDMDSFLSLQTVCKKIQFLVNLPLVWQRIPLVHPIDRSLNLSCFRFHAERNRGTEGVCYEAFCRKKKEFLAIKRARVYPEIEGIPYYMMREIAALKKISHPNVCPLQFVHLHKSKLYLFFPFVPLTLCELLPSKDVEEVELDDLVPKPVVQSLMEQLLQAVRYCHSRGIIHRNIKPKHLLVIPGPDPAYPLEGSRLQLADFALARIIDHPPHPYTSEVITLWYRPPEILMGQRNYTAAVDMWSCGCIFAELLQGRPLFLGLCEIDQLLQIFSKLGLPNEHNWEDFTAMPHYQSDLFPRWEESRLEGQLREYTSSIELDLLQQFLRYNPLDRISAKEALQHIYFMDNNSSPVPSYSSSDSSWESSASPPHPELRHLHKTTLSQHSFFRQLELQRPPFLLSSSTKKRSSGSNTVDPTMLTMRDSTGSTIIRRGIYNGSMRILIIDWLVSMMDIFSVMMSSRTIYFAVALLDAYLLQDHSCLRGSGGGGGDGPAGLVQVTSLSELRMVAATCLYIASKCEDVSHIGVGNLAPQNDLEESDYSSRDILSTEESILNVLGFDIYLPTVIDYLHMYLHCVPVLADAEEHTAFAKYMAEMSLIHFSFLSFPASMIATSICIYTLIQFEQIPFFPASLASLSFFTYMELLECITALRDAHIGMPSLSYSTVYRRYCRPELHSVATFIPRIHIPPTDAP